MSLTDDWKEGKLENGSQYWITYKNGKPFVATFRRSKTIIDFWKFYDYENEYDDGAGYDYVNVIALCNYEELQRLKYLLNECKTLFFPFGKYFPISGKKQKELLTRINTAIGESEE